jgi:hypothetical protein
VFRQVYLLSSSFLARIDEVSLLSRESSMKLARKGLESRTVPVVWQAGEFGALPFIDPAARDTAASPRDRG